jgi:hypothetical protein
MKFSEISAAQGAPPIKKIFNQKSFKYFVWTPLGSRINKIYAFFFKFILRCKHPDIVPFIITTGITGHRQYRWQIYQRVVDTGGAP